MSDKKKRLYIIEPEFYKSFECTGSQCPDNCCHGWIIKWRKKEIDKLLQSDCSYEFKKDIINSFISYEDYWIINVGNGRCPMLTENNLCRIQKELGIEYMSRTCMDYPRMRFKYNGWYRTCEISCGHVIEILCNTPYAMRLETRKVMLDEELTAHADSATEILNHQYLKFRSSIFNFFGKYCQMNHEVLKRL